jgi:CRISPR-associated protein Csb2
VTTAHARSYQPLFGVDATSGRQKTSLVLDPFVVVGGGAADENACAILEWPNASLDTQSGNALDRWLSCLGYLGRAESWVEASREDVQHTRATVELAGVLESPADVVRLLTPDTSDGKLLLAALTTDTQALFQQRLADPPASRWADYVVHEPIVRAPRYLASPRQTIIKMPTMVRLAIGTRVQPRLTDAVRFGERVRAALMSRSKREDGMPHPVFSGKTAAGVPLQENAHLHVLPLDEDRDGGIDHILLWAPGGFDSEAMRAVQSLVWLWGDGGFDIRLAMTGESRVDDDNPAASLGIPSIHRLQNAVAVSTQWRSRTPFVLTRHPKVRNGQLRDGPEEQLLREFARLGLPAVTNMQRILTTDAPVDTQWHRFRLQRTTGSGSRGGDRGYGFSVTFAEPVRGPLAVGYGARQGLGQFEPMR